MTRTHKWEKYTHEYSKYQVMANSHFVATNKSHPNNPMTFSYNNMVTFLYFNSLVVWELSFLPVCGRLTLYNAATLFTSFYCL